MQPPEQVGQPLDPVAFAVFLGYERDELGDALADELEERGQPFGETKLSAGGVRKGLHEA